MRSMICISFESFILKWLFYIITLFEKLNRWKTGIFKEWVLIFFILVSLGWQIWWWFGGLFFLPWLGFKPEPPGWYSLVLTTTPFHFLFRTGHIKLADFGLCKILNSPGQPNRCSSNKITHICEVASSTTCSMAKLTRFKILFNIAMIISLD